MTIEERIKEAKKKRNEAYKKDSVQGIVYWDGYLDALKEAHNEEKTSEVDELRKKLAKAEDKIMALCVEKVDFDEMTTYILNHYAKVKACEIFEALDKHTENLNFYTGNFEVYFKDYTELKKKYTEDGE